MTDRTTGPAATAPTPTVPASTWEGTARLLEHFAIGYRRTWKGSAISSFLSPLLYVVALGVLLGGFVESDPATLEGATSYLAFVAPGMLAAQAMTTVFGEATYPVMSAVKWNKTYLAMLSTPLRVRDVVAGQILFIVARVVLTCAVFTLVMAPFGVFTTWWGALAAFAVQVPLGLAFAAPLFAFSVGLRDETPFSLVFRLGMIPLFLFSGAFFPVANLGPGLEVVAWLTPLWHGVDLTRMLTVAGGPGDLDPLLAAAHLAYLLVLAVLGWWWALRRLARRTAT